jgi:hypothetical protein
MVRILPMDREYEFDNRNYQEVQNDFFLNELPSRKDVNGQGKYCYKKQSMKADEGSTLVLFQYDNQIIACADLNKIVKLTIPEDVYHGAFYFEPSSIKIFTPITNNELNASFNCVKKFGQVKHSLNLEYVNNFMDILSNIESVNINKLQVNEKPTCIPNIRDN